MQIALAQSVSIIPVPEFHPDANLEASPGPSREGGGVGGVGGLGPAKVLFSVETDCTLGPGAMKYPGARTGSRRPRVSLVNGQTRIKTFKI